MDFYLEDVEVHTVVQPQFCGYVLPVLTLLYTVFLVTRNILWGSNQRGKPASKTSFEICVTLAMSTRKRHCCKVLGFLSTQIMS